MRGQWFYCDDDAATRYVWFHSVSDLVRRAIDDPRIDVVDLGPSGSDAFTELKEKYGFIPITDWPAAADYSGDFIYEDSQNEVETMGDEMIKMIEHSLPLLLPLIKCVFGPSSHLYKQIRNVFRVADILRCVTRFLSNCNCESKHWCSRISTLHSHSRRFDERCW